MFFNKKKLHKNKMGSSTVMGIFFLLPSIILIIMWVYIPLVWNFILSFQSWDGFLNKKWVMFDNYTNAFKDAVFRKCLFNSVYMAVVQTAGAVLLGLFVSLVIYRLQKKEGAVYRLLIFMPVMMPAAIIGLLFSFIYNPEMGIINNLLKVIGMGRYTNAWLADINTVIPSINLVGIWRMAGVTMMLSFAAMQTLPESLFEASKLEGANYVRQVVTFVLPLIKPILLTALLYTIGICFKTYDLVVTLTGGGPAGLSKTVPLYMVETAFTYNEFGYAASMGTIFTVVVVVVILCIKKGFGGESYEY